MSSSCSDRCSGRHKYISQKKLDAVRRRLDFSDVSESERAPPTPSARYGGFKKVAEKHSSHEMIAPMYTTEQLAAVPESFLDLFRSRLGPSPTSPQPAPRRARSPVPQDVDIPESFLEFCQERMGPTCPGAGSPQSPSTRSSPRSPMLTSDSSYYVQGPSPWGTSYYGGGAYDNPGQQYGMIFKPRITSTPEAPCRARSPSPPPAPRSTIQPQVGYGGYQYPVREGASPARGIGKYAYPPSRSPPPTPPTPSFARRDPRNAMESTCSSGDLLDSPSPSRRSRGERSRGDSMSMPPMGYPQAQRPPVINYVEPTIESSMSTSSPGYPMAQSTPRSPLKDYLNTERPSSASRSGAKNTSSNLSVRRRGDNETIDTDDLLQQSGKSGCPACPTLGVTPVQSGVSVRAEASTENTSVMNKQNISKSIEHELLAREVQEKSQLEADLLRWQQARRKLVMNTANMGS